MILVDTSALVAVADRGDRHHDEAGRTWKALRARGERFLVTDLIVAEVAIVLRRRAGHRAAVDAVDAILGSAVVEVVAAERPLLEEAMAILRRYRQRELSLTDCVSAALARRRKVSRVFAYDDDFRALGFEIVAG